MQFKLSADPEKLKEAICYHLRFTLGLNPLTAATHNWWAACALAIRDKITERYIATQKRHYETDTARVYYLSLEYLMGRLLRNNLFNTGLFEQVKSVMAQLGQDIDAVMEAEADMGLGNGGLGRLAVCFLDSLATLQYPTIGYGIHYEFGLFAQEFVDGKQVEHPDHWLDSGQPWQFVRPEYTQEVGLYGCVEYPMDERGQRTARWVPASTLLGVPWDIPIVGYGADTVNYLRLWESRGSKEFDFSVFNQGGYVEAVREKAIGETVSKVLYPNDATESGKELRLVQQYFFVSCSLQDILRRYRLKHKNWDALPEKVVIQLNDTHPALAVVEFMRLMIDKSGLEWDQAWALCQKIFAYTNHTLLPEALERWSVPLFSKVLPRHLEIIFQINQKFLEEVVEPRFPGDSERRRALSIIEEGSPQYIRMAYLAVVASFSINGVAAMHSDLLKKTLFSGFYELFADRFNNKTNGITPRRWLRSCNPRLSSLIDTTIGAGWTCDLDQLKALEPYAQKPAFRQAFMDVKHANKVDLCPIIKKHCGVDVSPDALFDVQIKRLHEYKRQHLNLLNILRLYQYCLENPENDLPPRVFIFGAKAAPGYSLAKHIIHSINAVGKKINNDPRIQNKLKVAFLPNYNVSLAEKIIPAADLSEQISTAGKEASGTGNMKLSLNGALTLGTLDGANVEIEEEVGPENIFIFGLHVDEVEALRRNGYRPWDYYNSNATLRKVLDSMLSDSYTPDEQSALGALRHSLLDGGDPFFVLADFQAYCDAQDAVGEVFKNPHEWARMAILNVARMGKFSSDRTIHEYARQIWKVAPVIVE